MNINVIGLDLAKKIFSSGRFGSARETSIKKKLRRAQMLTYFANLKPCTVAMEACAPHTNKLVGILLRRP